MTARSLMPGLHGVGIGVDIGGTTTKASVLDAAGAVIGSASLPTEPGAHGVVETATAVVIAAANTADVDVADCVAIGAGIPGLVDPLSGTVRFAVNVGLGADPLDLGSRLSAGLGRHVHVENDVRAATLGADWHLNAASADVDDVCLLSVGTGISAGYVRNGALHRGSHLVAGEIGHVPIDPAGPACVCGQHGCIEAIASGASIDRRWPVSDGSSVAAVHAAVVAGDSRATAVWGDVVRGLSRAVSILALTFDPQVIVLSGGVAALGAPLLDAIASSLAADAARAEFLGSLAIGSRLRLIDSAIPLGPLGALRAAATAVANADTVAP